MYNYDAEIQATCKKDKKAWNGKVITTSKQWLFNDFGSACVGNYSYSQILDSYAEYHRDCDEWG